MKLSKSHKKFIKQNYKELTTQQLAAQTGLSEKTIVAYLKQTERLHKTRTEDEQAETYKLTSCARLLTLLKENIPAILILTVICWLVYANALNGEFVSDDIPAYVQNPVMRDIKMLLTFRYFSVQALIQFITFNLFGLDPTPLHVVSVVLHNCATILVFVIAYTLIGKKGSLLSALLFAVHPMLSESVAWISALSYLLNSVLAFITITLYLLHVHSGRKSYFVTLSVLYILGIFLLQSAWVFVIPIILITLDQFIIRKKINLKGLLKFSPVLVATLAYVLVLFLPSILARVEYVEGLNFDNQQKLTPITTIPYTVTMSLKLLLYPQALTFYHEGELLGIHFLLISKIIFIVVVGIVVYLYKKTRLAAGLLTIVLVSLAPSYSPFQVAWFFAERYMYIGTAFFAMVVVLVLTKLEKKFAIKNFTVAIIIAISVLFAIRTIDRNKDWKTPKQLWLATAEVSPNSPRVHNNLGDSYATEENYEKSIEHFKTAIAIRPLYAEAHHNLGRTYLLAGNLDAAEVSIKRALEIKPDIYQSYYLLGLIESKKAHYAKALEYFNKTLELNPGDPDATSAVKSMEARLISN